MFCFSGLMQTKQIENAQVGKAHLRKKTKGITPGHTTCEKLLAKKSLLSSHLPPALPSQ